jgi:nucleoid DNA-binding protein
MRKNLLALAALLGAIALVMTTTPAALSEKPAAEESMTQRLAKQAKVSEEAAKNVLAAFGPIVREELSKGKTVSLPGLGTFRVVRVAEHKDLRNGRPVTVPAVNTVEFIGTDSLVDAANSDKAVPAEEVPAFQYVPLPDQTPGQKVPPTRVPSTRVP